MLIYLIAILSGFCYASLLYLFNRKQHYGKTLTAMLFFMRLVAVGSLVMLLFNPCFKSRTDVVEPATIIVAQDNSASLILAKDSLFYKNEYPLVLDTLINKLEDKFIIDKYLFGNEVKEFSSIDYKDYYTDFHQILDNIKKDYYRKNVGAVVLLSDGICNKSYRPEQNIESYPFTIHTVTLGDTANYPDLYVKDVFYNKTSPSNTTMPLRIVANANNCRDRIMKVKLIVDDEIVEEKDFVVNSNRFSQTIDFNIDSEDEGVKQIDIKIDAYKDETITANNDRRLFIEVVDKKYKALFYAKAPHPDLGSLKNVMGEHFETEMFFGDDDIPDLNGYDLIVLHQIPYFGMGNLEDLKAGLDKNKDIPVFYVIGEGTDFYSFNDMQKSMKITKGAVNAILDIKPHYNPNFGLFSVDKEVMEVASSFPPLSLPHLEFSLNSNHDMMLQMNISDVLMQAPLLSFTVADGRKCAYLLGTGIWRWKLNDFYRHKNNDIFEEMFAKSVKYLLTEKDKELVVIHEDSYLNNEPIRFTADMKNPSQEMTNEADLRIRIVNKHSKDYYDYDFAKREKSYYLDINSLPEGVYEFAANAVLGGKTYSESGSFSVVSVGAEAQDLVADSQRMQLLASLTGGNNFNVDEMDKLVEAIENDERITSIMREETSYKDLINMKSLFILILTFVSVEWLLRKMFGIY